MSVDHQQWVNLTQLSVAWLTLFTGVFGQGEIVRVDLATGTTNLAATLHLSAAESVTNARPQLVDLDGDGTLELLVSGEPTLVLDGATGVLLDEVPGLNRFATDQDGNLVPATLGPRLDLDGNGVLDRVEDSFFDVTVADDDFSVFLAIAESVFPGPGRREVTVYTELRGTTTWPLLCDP